MTVQELIEQLQNFPKDMPVVVDGYASGATSCNDVSELEEVGVELNCNKEWYYGAHELSGKPDATVLWLSGDNPNAS